LREDGSFLAKQHQAQIFIISFMHTLAFPNSGEGGEGKQGDELLVCLKEGWLSHLAY
jgi:hypothetical protein